MLTLTVLLLVLGALLAALGTLGFVLVWQAPSHYELCATQRTATAGRWMSTAGLLMYIPAHAASGLSLAALILTAIIAAASRITKTTSRIIPAN